MSNNHVNFQYLTGFCFRKEFHGSAIEHIGYGDNIDREDNIESKDNIDRRWRGPTSETNDIKQNTRLRIKIPIQDG
jgi:hypothetical protein